MWPFKNAERQRRRVEIDAQLMRIECAIGRIEKHIEYQPLTGRQDTFVPTAGTMNPPYVVKWRDAIPEPKKRPARRSKKK